jgi:hypothetical protein
MAVAVTAVLYFLNAGLSCAEIAVITHERQQTGATHPQPVTNEP